MNVNVMDDNLLLVSDSGRSHPVHERLKHATAEGDEQVLYLFGAQDMLASTIAKEVR